MATATTTPTHTYGTCAACGHPMDSTRTMCGTAYYLGQCTPGTP